MKSIVTGVAAACLAAAIATAISNHAAAQGANVGGRYQVQGKNFNGSTYSGTAEITVTSNNTCRIVWVTGGTTSRGICMRNETSFVAGYQLGNSIGLVIYDIKPDGSLDSGFAPTLNGAVNAVAQQADQGGRGLCRGRRCRHCGPHAGTKLDNEPGTARGCREPRWGGRGARDPDIPHL